MKKNFSNSAGIARVLVPAYNQPNLPGMFFNTSGDGSLHQVQLGRSPVNQPRATTYNGPDPVQVQRGRSCLPRDDRE